MQQRQNEGFDAEVPGYQSRLMQAEQQFNNGQTPNDFYKISATAKQQTEALRLLYPTWLQLQSLQDSIKRMKDAGLNITLGQQEYQQDLAEFQAASLPENYQKLQDIITAHMNQMAADQVAAIPFIGAAMLTSFQQLIDQGQTYGVDVTTYQQQLALDRQDLASAHTLPVYLELSSRIQSQMNDMQGALLEGKTTYDLQQLKSMIATTALTNDYEYQDGTDAYGDEVSYLKYAQTSDDYQTIDDQVDILLANLQALLKNMNDTTAHNQPHATDLQLMEQDNLMSGNVVVVSLTEQTLRAYTDGVMVKTFPIVTGRQEAPTPPGLWHVFLKGRNLTFKSSEPVGSALWYPPTPINYGMEYHWGGFYLHDATWRQYFGPGANLPHNDQTSGIYSDDGSHGCINMTLSNTAWLYSFTAIGTPVLVY